MTMAAAIESRTAQANVGRSRAASRPSTLLPISAGPRRSGANSKSGSASHTPYQRFDFLAAWQRQVGEREGLRPFIVIASDAEQRPLLLLPLALGRRHGVNVASFMGGKHSTFNMALWDGEFAASATQADMEALIAGIAARGEPTCWRCTSSRCIGAASRTRWRCCRTSPPPMIVRCWRIEPGAAPAALISNSFRRRLKGKERKLQSLPGYPLSVANSDADITRLLDWFFRIKPLRMAEQKLPNVFADPGVEDFIRAACTTPIPGGGHAIDIHALECDEEVIAIFAGVADGHRFSMMFNTYTMSASSKYSPGLILMRDIIDHYAALNYRALDLGIGSDDYKRLFCKSDEPIFDSFFPLNARGKMAAAAMSAINRAKRMVKHNPALFEMAQKLRGALR